MGRYTYEITFTHRDGEEEVQQHTREDDAREAFRMFDEPDSAEIYSGIRLTRYDWETGSEELLESMSF